MTWNVPILPFLEYYTDPLPIRSRGAFQILSARRAHDGSPCVLVLPGTSADRRRVGEALAEVERVHALLDHPLIPKVAARGEARGIPYLELACDAVTDGIEVIHALLDADRKIPYGAADAFTASLREALQAAHAVVDPRTGGPICLGGISAGNALFNARGRWFLVGFARNFPIERGDGAIDVSMATFRAPEIASGAAPSPMGDYVALLLFVRSMLPYIDLSGAVGRILRGDIRPTDVELIETMRWVDQRLISEVPSLRPSMAEAIAAADRIRELLGEKRDPDGFAAFIAALLERNDEPTRIEGQGIGAPLSLTLGPGAVWVAGPDGARHRLGRSFRGLVLSLVERHERDQGAPLSVWDLLEAGWPGERPALEAGANRVYVTLNRLRRMGLRDLIERSEDGYRLARRTTVRVVA